MEFYYGTQSDSFRLPIYIYKYVPSNFQTSWFSPWTTHLLIFIYIYIQKTSFFF